MSGLDLSYYHPTDVLLDAFTRLADPSRCGTRLMVENLRDAEDPSFQLRLATFSADQSFSFEADAPKRHVLLNFGVHGRELISAEVALRLASMLCGEAPSRFEGGSAERSRARISDMLRRVSIKMVPVQVPSARQLAEVGGGSCKQRRLNARGVDVNRNWDVAWHEGDRSEGSSQYRGPRPLSEPETRVLANLAREWKPDLFVDVRSGDRYMAMPYASRDSGPRDRRDRAAMIDAMRKVNAMFSSAHPSLLRLGGVPTGPASSLGEEPYRATGTALDYMYSVAHVRRSFMFEVFGASTVYGVGRRGERSIGRVPTAVVSFAQVAEGGEVEEERRANASTTLRASRRSRRVRRKLLQLGRAEPTSAPHSLEPAAFVSVAEGSESPARAPLGLSAGLESEEHPFDCVAFFNPTTFDDYEVTVNGWADALLVMINATVWSAESEAK